VWSLVTSPWAVSNLGVGGGTIENLKNFRFDEELVMYSNSLFRYNWLISRKNTDTIRHHLPCRSLRPLLWLLLGLQIDFKPYLPSVELDLTSPLIVPGPISNSKRHTILECYTFMFPNLLLSSELFWTSHVKEMCSEKLRCNRQLNFTKNLDRKALIQNMSVFNIIPR